MIRLPILGNTLQILRIDSLIFFAISQPTGFRDSGNTYFGVSGFRNDFFRGDLGIIGEDFVWVLMADTALNLSIALQMFPLHFPRKLI